MYSQIDTVTDFGWMNTTRRGEAMLKEIKRIPNGETLVRFEIYLCDKCGNVFDESEPHTKDLCWDCSLIYGVISEKEYLKFSGFTIDNAHASVINGKVIVWLGEKAPWEKTNKELRNTAQYKKWRTLVFKRDDYTCQHCGIRGGELNAHHVKPFAKYKNLRYDVDNGLTLCVECHRNVHKRSR